jgi:hypothetical protein
MWRVKLRTVLKYSSGRWRQNVGVLLHARLLVARALTLSISIPQTSRMMTGAFDGLLWIAWIFGTRNKRSPWNRALLENLIVAQLVKKFPALYRNPRFITIFTGDFHWSQNPAHTLARHFFKTYLNIILPPTHGSSKGSIPGFRPELLWKSHLSHACCVRHPHHPFWFDNPNQILWTVQIMKLLIAQFSPSSCHFLLLDVLSTLFSNRDP